MKKLTALKNYLIQLQVVTPEKLVAYPENNRIDIISKPGEKGLEISQVTYDAIFEMDQVKVSYTALVAIISAWLAEQDTARNNQAVGQPQFDYDPTDNHTADIQLSIEFCEPVYLVETEHGPINYDHQRYDTGDYDLWVAETGEVTDGSTR
ncbi:phage tail protein [Spartinivicinus ruber]|uniref:phage tail protein n=1 Tax=Spartinivicinus ruber TaxID=2683272 RepID=UPI0013D827D4|nr:phage tail protein [Spartinivicinus ruber]